MPCYVNANAATMAHYGFLPVARRQTDKFEVQETQPWVQEGSDVPVLVDKKRDELQGIEIYSNNIEQSEIDLIDIYEDDIEQAIDRRIALFFEQTIVCHRMPFHFESVEANDQYGGATSLTLPIVNERTNQITDQKTYRYEAAHTSTTPCLLAYIRTEWNQYQEQKNQGNQAVAKPRSFVYLKGSSGYKSHNATLDMPSKINRADCLIDGSAENSTGLRFQTIALINQVALGRLDPVRATKEFLGHFEHRLQQLQATPGPRGRVMQLYLQRVQAIKTDLQQDETIFDQLLGVKINLSPQALQLREIVYRKRFLMIQSAQIIESRIAKKIHTVETNLQLDKQNKRLLKFAILQSVTPQEKKIVERLFCKTQAVLEASYLTDYQNYLRQQNQNIRQINTKVNRASAFQQAVQTFKTAHQQAIQVLLRDLRADFRELSNAELDFRASLFKDLRGDLHHWRQKDFVVQFKQRYPLFPMSQAMVSRLEQRTRLLTQVVYQTPLSQRRKDITIEDALRYAETLEVEAGLFMPGVFTSAE